MDTERVHRWIFGLWYPALLDAFGILVALGRPENLGYDIPYWEIPVLLYLTIQFGEGADPERDYTPIALFKDVLEIVAMSAFFVALGYMFIGEPIFEFLRSQDGARWALFALLFIPPAFRGVRFVRAKQNERRLMCKYDGFYLSITGLAILASIVGLAGINSQLAFWFVSFILLSYLFFFVLCNNLIACSSDCNFHRPEAKCVSAERKKDRNA